jgi:hypothetical protein
MPWHNCVLPWQVKRFHTFVFFIGKKKKRRLPSQTKKEKEQALRGSSGGYEPL